MKIIFSRKGFDAENGGMASPILPDGTMLSFPIPQNNDDAYFMLLYKDKSYWDMIRELKPNNPKLRTDFCHLDPDIRKGIKDRPRNWKPIFGQCDAAETHLENQVVETGDIFLFFGWFRKTLEKDGKLCYDRASKDIHALFGYLQIGEIIRDERLFDYPWHPHAGYCGGHNTMYVASERLIIDGEDMGIPGAGTFRYSDELVLTYPGMPKSRWKLPEFFKEVNISCHSKDCFKPEGYFQTVRIG